MPNNIDWKDRQGFTLIETVVAVLILTIGLLALAQLFVLATYTNTFAHDQAVEVKAAEDTMEMLRSLPNFDDPKLSIGGTIRSTPDACATGCLPDENHVLGIFFEPVTIGGSSVVVSNRMATAPFSTVAGSDWSKRQFEIRWQVIGYPTTPPAGGAAPPQFMAFNAYDDLFPTSPTDIYPLTPPDLRGQTSLIVIVRVIPVGAKGRNRLAKRVQLAAILSRP
jgi:prepilin-type N-terminal cleavage/methylation domain-containing protein